MLWSGTRSLRARQVGLCRNRRGNRTVVHEVCARLTHSDVHVRRAALRALSLLLRRGDRHAITRLVPLLADYSPTVRSRGARPSARCARQPAGL